MELQTTYIWNKAQNPLSCNADTQDREMRLSAYQLHREDAYVINYGIMFFLIVLEMIMIHEKKKR